MRELEDIVLKKGDLIYSIGIGDKDETEEIVSEISLSGILPENLYTTRKITRIKRPVYEIIYEAPKQTLTKEEKEWLEHFLRPFKDRVIKIEKGKAEESNQYILIRCKTSRDDIWLPSFKENKYYKGMELDKEYTLKELGLFEGE